MEKWRKLIHPTQFIQQRQTERLRDLEEVSQTPSLKDVLVNATFATNRAINNNIAIIQLKSFDQEARELMGRTLASSPMKEHAKLIYVSPDKSVQIHTRPVIGDENSVKAISTIKPRIPISIWEDMPREFRQSRYIASLMHTHPMDLPPSPNDLKSLLIGDMYPYAHTAVFVITPQQRYMIFRSQNTPELTYSEVNRITTQWNETLDEEVGRRVFHVKNATESAMIENKVQITHLDAIRAKYDLRIFKGNPSEPFLKKT